MADAPTFRYVFESSLTWSEMRERLTMERIPLRSTAYISVKHQENWISFNLYQMVEHDFSATFCLTIHRAENHRYPVAVGSEVYGCMLMLTPVVGFGLLLLLTVSVFQVLNATTLLWGIDSRLSLEEALNKTWQNTIGLWFTFFSIGVLWLLLMLFGNIEGDAHHTVRKAVEPLLKGKLRKTEKFRAPVPKPFSEA